MLDLSIYGMIADKMEEFVSGMEKTTVISSDLTKLSDIIPSLSENLSIISNWINGTDVSEKSVILETKSEPVEEKKIEIVNVPATTNSAPKATESRKHYQISKEKALEIAQFIADKCDGRKVEKAIITVSNKFKKIPPKSIQRLIKKETFDRYTDAYFIIENDVIMAFKQKIQDKFDASDVSRDAIKKLLRDNSYDVIKTIMPDMSANDILMIATVRWHLFRRGEVNDLGGGVKEIFIMDAITRNRRANSEEIIKAINNDYHIDVDTPLISAVRTGRAYKEISSKFGVCAKI